MTQSFRIQAAFIAAAWLACGAIVASAQTNYPHDTNTVVVPFGPPKLSLAEAREVSFRRNWDLLAAKSGIDAADAQLIIAKEFPNPTASLTTAKWGTYDNATLVPHGNNLWNRSYDTIVAVSQLIEIGGKRHDRQVAAREGLIGAKARFYDAKRTLDQGVTKAYVAAVLADQNVRILNESAGFLNHEAEIGQARLKAGDISASDEKQIEINAEQFELQAKAAEATAVQARIAVEVLMGVDKPKGNWIATDVLDILVKAPKPEEVAGAERPDVRAARSDVAGAQANLKLQKAIRIPDPTFSLQYEHNPNQPTPPPSSDTIGFGVSFPLPLWNLNGGNIKAARASVDQFQFALQKAAAQAAADESNAESEYMEAFERWKRYTDTTAPKSSQVRESVAFAYNKGAASLVDLLDAQKTDNDIRLAAAQSAADTASAVADLVAARSVVSEVDVKQK